MSIGAMYKLADSWLNQARSGVMLTTLAAQPICAKIGHEHMPGGGPGLLQSVGVLGRQCEVVWGDDVCLSEKRRSFQIAGAIRTEVASC